MQVGWNNIASIINERFSTNYTEYQCKGKFQNLVRDYTRVRLKLIICGLKTLETVFDQVYNTNTFSRRRELRCRNHTPLPTYDEVSSMLSAGHRESTTNQRDQFASPIRRVPSRREENVN
ncbi:hypothetical protein F8M41_006434 [Gigaspora margarita]|uniref:Myb/SANT-like domain-containing protein n=1 Tax=Gigaspora margarita TaxID=4874 RepID=A0A8H4A630_GIGMA|nr:hypothetical protein F8M41_006434 [Gigaspora margarita]